MVVVIVAARKAVCCCPKLVERVVVCRVPNVVVEAVVNHAVSNFVCSFANIRPDFRRVVAENVWQLFLRRARTEIYVCSNQ